MFGFEVINSNGEIVMDDKSPVMNVIASGSITGTFNAAQEASPQHYRFAKPAGGGVRFVKLPPSGSYVGSFYGQIVSDQPTLQYIDAIHNYAGQPQATGYGIEVFDANGNTTFSSDRPMLVFSQDEESYFTALLGTQNVTTSGEWVAIVGVRHGYFSPFITDGPEYSIIPTAERLSEFTVRLSQQGLLIGPGTNSQDQACDGSFLFAR